MSFRHFALVCASFAAATVSASAADLRSRPAPDALARAVAVVPTMLPAVSGINGSIEAAGGYAHGHSPLGNGGYGHIGGTLSIPLAHEFGAQVDALAATVDGISVLGAGGHAFWRNPATGLVGLYGEALTADVGSDRLNKGRLGAEAEYYMDRLTLSGVAGYEFGNLHTRKGAFVETLAGYYATDDLKLSVGYGYGFAGNAGVARVDWQLPPTTGLANVTVFAEGRIGEGGYRSIIAGVKVPLGAAPKSLKDRQRQDDPPAWINSQPQAIASAKAQGQFDKKPETCASLQQQFEAVEPKSEEGWDLFQAGLAANCAWAIDLNNRD
jgi:hypothetical protein